MNDPEVQRVMMENMKKLGFGPGMGGGGFMWESLNHSTMLK
jgi:hypothetical protein